MLEGVEIYPLEVKHDERGWLVEVLKGHQVPAERPFGQFYITTARPGVSKGNHYHLTKTEWFCVIKGDAQLVLEDHDSGEQMVIPMGEDNMVTVKIPAGVAHGIKNVGQSDMYLLAYIDAVFDPADPDTHRQAVVG